MTNTANYSDWQVIQLYIDNYNGFIDPFLFNTLRGRGLVWVINDLDHEDKVATKAAAYGRLLNVGKVFGDEQIDEIAHYIERMKKLQSRLVTIEPTNTSKIVSICEDINIIAKAIEDHFRYS